MGDNTFTILKGPWCWGASFIVPYGRARFLASSQTFWPMLHLASIGLDFLVALLSAWVASIFCCLNCLTLFSTRGFGCLPLETAWLGVPFQSEVHSERSQLFYSSHYYVLGWQSVVQWPSPPDWLQWDGGIVLPIDSSFLLGYRSEGDKPSRGSMWFWVLLQGLC